MFKLRAFLLAVMFVSFVTSCDEHFALFEGGEFYLKLNQPTTLIDGTILELIEVEDSRCPDGVECIWEGRAAVLLSWKRNENFDIQLNDVEYKTAQVQEFSITLVDLMPYPTQQNGQQQKVARIKIEVN